MRKGWTLLDPCFSSARLRVVGEKTDSFIEILLFRHRNQTAKQNFAFRSLASQDVSRQHQTTSTTVSVGSVCAKKRCRAMLSCPPQPLVPSAAPEARTNRGSADRPPATDRLGAPYVAGVVKNSVGLAVLMVKVMSRGAEKHGKSYCQSQAQVHIAPSGQRLSAAR